MNGTFGKKPSCLDPHCPSGNETKTAILNSQKIDDDQTEFREHNECLKNKLFVERGVNVERAEERNYLRHRLNDV